MCKLYIVSFCFFSPLSQGTYHRTIHCYNCSIPWYCQIWGTVVFFYSSVFFQYLFHLGFDLFDKHVEKVLLQHGLGTPYSNSACFDKDDIWTFCSFLYSACQLHYFPPPSPKIEFYSKLVIGLNWPIVNVLSKHSTPMIIFFFVFDMENILYLTEVDNTVVIASVFYFSIVD